MSGSEVAFFSLNPKEKKWRKNIALFRLLNKPKKLLATILIVNNIVNIAIIILTEMFLNITLRFDRLGTLAEWIIKIVLVTSILLLFGEVLPKVYASNKPEKFAKMMLKPMLAYQYVFGFLSRFLTATSEVIDRGKSQNFNISVGDLSAAVQMTSTGVEDEEEHKLLHGIAEFGKTEAKQIMTSRVDMVAVSISMGFDELKVLINTEKYSRIPVYKENIDHIEGAIYVKDLIQYIHHQDNFRWQSFMKDVYFIPESKKINDLLVEFQSMKKHLAVVVDEYGGVSGLVTLEDVLEEIVGNISNEHDDEEVEYEKINENLYLFSGKTLIHEFCDILDIDRQPFDARKGESETLAGLVLECLGRFPKPKEQIEFQNMTFKVLDLSGYRINQLKVSRNDR
ncbi:MAG: gliding motility-associated protein GldE [Flavobacteriales bacterium]